MTIDMVIGQLTKEKQEGLSSRFPCRAIMVKNLKQYCELLAKLQTIPDTNMVPSRLLFPAADLMPQYDALLGEQFRDQWLILPGVSEYLRLFGASEAEKQRFGALWRYQAPADSTGRILIPLWGCEAQWHDKSLRLVNDIRRDEDYFNCIDNDEAEEAMEIIVLSNKFEQYKSKLYSLNGQFFTGLQEWYAYWSSPVPTRKDYVLMTGRENSVQAADGSISIRVIKDTLSFIRETMENGHILTRENCPPAATDLLFEFALKGETVENAIAAALNIHSITGQDIAGKWSILSTGQKQLVKLWYTLHSDDSYFSHCVLKAASEADLFDRILSDIFPLRLGHPDWVEESQDLVSLMGLQKGREFFEALDEIPDFSSRLPFLRGKSKEEHIYLLHMTGLWARQDVDDLLENKQLESLYPELFAYLEHEGSAVDADLREYLSRYKAHKLANTLPEDEGLHFAGADPDAYDYRYSVLSDALTDDCLVLWVDAMGMEWSSLLVHELKKLPDTHIDSVRITQAALPTETSFNSQWLQMAVPHEKLDKLDKLAHKGIVDDPDYYACVEEQLSFISELAHKYVKDCLRNYRRVILTGDHGTSRLAARFFHKRPGMPVPPGASVFSHGRYCSGTGSAVADPNLRSVNGADGTVYSVYSNYDHFTSPGFAAGVDDENALYGEIHGGASPEEMLVPVIVIDSTKERPVSGTWKNTKVRIMAKKAKVAVTFNKPVHSLQMRIGGIDGSCSAGSDSKEWTAVFDGLQPNTYEAAVLADGALVSMPMLTIISALGNEDGDLP